MNFDTILEDAGEFGMYQKLVIYVVLLPAVLPCGFHAYSQLFMAARPDHWCKIPALKSLETNNMELIKNISIPLELRDGVFKHSECSMYNLDYTRIQDTVSAHHGSMVNAFEHSLNATTIECSSGWNYNKSLYENTVVTEWDLVCAKDFYATFALVLFGVAGLVGNYIFGYLQDTLGRKPSFFIYLLIQCVFGVATAFAQNYVTWIIFRIGVGFTVPAILATPYVLAIELVGPKHRTLCTIVSNIAYSIGLVLLGVVAYMVREWRRLSLATALPFVALFLFWSPMPESPRWLFANRRFSEAEGILKTMARVNGKELPANYLNYLKDKYESEEEKKEMENENKEEPRHGVYDLFRTPNLRRKTLIIMFIWFTNTSVYVGLSYYAPILGGDEFLNFILAGAVELPTYLFLWPAMERLGRRWTLCISMVVGGTACLATFLVQNDSTVTLTLYCVGKMGISSSFVVLPLMASELYPTVIRGLGMSISSVVGMLGPIFIPLVNYLGGDMMVLPLIIMGVLLVAGGAASLLLPETLNQHLPQTLEDGEKYGIGMGFCCQPPTKLDDFSFEDIQNRKKRESLEREEIVDTAILEQTVTHVPTTSSLKHKSYLIVSPQKHVKIQNCSAMEYRMS